MPPRGERRVEAAPHGHWQATTFAGALRADGFVAPVVSDGAVNGELFLADIEQTPSPALRPGDGVVMDNLGSHKVAGVGAAIEAAGGRLLYLPPYSPDLKARRERRLEAQAAPEQGGRANRRGAVVGHRPFAR
jgi:hypothetical protein